MFGVSYGFGGCPWCLVFFFQAEDGIRDLVRSRGLGDVYKRQALSDGPAGRGPILKARALGGAGPFQIRLRAGRRGLSLIHI